MIGAGLHRHHRGFAENDAMVAQVDQRVRPCRGRCRCRWRTRRKVCRSWKWKNKNKGAGSAVSGRLGPNPCCLTRNGSKNRKSNTNPAFCQPGACSPSKSGCRGRGIGHPFPDGALRHGGRGPLRCQRCGNCCRWPGEVRSRPEIARIAAFLGLGGKRISSPRYTDVRLNRTGLTLVSRPNHECIFLDGIATAASSRSSPTKCAGFSQPMELSPAGATTPAKPIAVPLDGPAETET